MRLFRNSDKRALTFYVLATIVCYAFGVIYEYFGFGVTSPFMHLAFLIPLLLGVVPYLLLTLSGKQDTVTGTGRVFWRLGLATLVTGSLFQGALDIYGTQSHLTVAYPVAGGLLLAAAAMTFLHQAFLSVLY